MQSTISEIGLEISGIISGSKPLPRKLSEQDKINKFLDSINNIKKKVSQQTERIEELDRLFSELTWLDLQNPEEEKLLREVIEKAKSFHFKSIRDFAEMKKGLWQDKIARMEITNFKEALDDFEDSVFEVEHIFFILRKDDEFNELTNSL